MVLPLENLLVLETPLSASKLSKMAQFPHPITVVLLNLRLLTSQMETRGMEYMYAQYLSEQEQAWLEKFTSEKRRLEWLGGRIAAKYAAVRLFAQNEKKREIVQSFADIVVISASNGRPSLAFNNRIWLLVDIPDISISHSGSMAAAMAARNGFCGIDIQKITPRVNKVQERFCTSSEKDILYESFQRQPEIETASLIKLWAAKEALRKACNKEQLPGFLDLQLINIQEESVQEGNVAWIFSLCWNCAVPEANNTYRVFITLVQDYVLALTARDDTLK